MSIAVSLLHVCFIFFVAFMVWKRDASALRKFFWPGLIVKLCAGIALGLVYLYYYDQVGDTFSLFQQGSVEASRATNDWIDYLKFLWQYQPTQQSRAVFFVKIVSIVSLITFNNYWIASLYFSLFSFLGAWILVKRIVLLLPASILAVAASFLFFPSVIFWSAGIIKESLSTGALFYLSSVFILLWMGTRVAWFEWILVVLAGWILWNLKYYYAAFFFPIVVATLVAKRFIIPRFSVKSFSVELLLWLLVMIVPVVLVFFLHPNFRPDQLLMVIVENNNSYMKSSAPSNVIHYDDLDPTVASVLFHAPWALFSGLFRPFILEASTFFKFLVSLENFATLLLTITGMIRLRNLFKATNRLLSVALIFYIAGLCIFLALSAPNFGTLVRYRIGFYPFLIFLVLYRNIFYKKIRSFLEKKHLVPNHL